MGKVKRIPGLKAVRIGNRLVSLSDSVVRDLLKRLEKKEKKVDCRLRTNRGAKARGPVSGGGSLPYPKERILRHQPKCSIVKGGIWKKSNG